MRRRIDKILASGRHLTQWKLFQHVTKIMAWVELIDWQVLKVRWMVNDEGNNQKVTGASYLNMVQHDVWPEVKGRERRNGWWWQQDDAPVHVTKDVINFVEKAFSGRVISRNGEVEWPAYSPDLSPLDYFFWGYALTEVTRHQPDTIKALKAIVEEVATDVDPDLIRRAVGNLNKRAKLCLEAGGSHFECAMD